MDKLFYTNEALTEKSAIPMNSQLPSEYFELLEYDLSSLPNDVTIYDIDWTGEGITTDINVIIAEKAKEALRKQYKADRDEALNELTVIVDEMEFDARPSDLSNFELGIATGQTEWVLANNSVATVTTAQLIEARDNGIIAGKAIWDNYIENLKSI